MHHRSQTMFTCNYCFSVPLSTRTPFAICPCLLHDALSSIRQRIQVIQDIRDSGGLVLVGGTLNCTAAGNVSSQSNLELRELLKMFIANVANVYCWLMTLLLAKNMKHETWNKWQRKRKWKRKRGVAAKRRLIELLLFCFHGEFSALFRMWSKMFLVFSSRGG